MADNETVEEIEEVEETFMTPGQLAEELDVDPKAIRAYLRREHTRPLESKNTSWLLDETLADLVREAFTPSEDDEDEELEELEDEDSEES